MAVRSRRPGPPTGQAQAESGRARRRRLRRPTGRQPAPTGRLRSTGFGWLLMTFALTLTAMLVFSRGLRGPAVAVTVADDAVVRWLAGHGGDALRPFLRAVAALGSAWTITILTYGMMLALVVVRRFRHLFVLLLSQALTGFAVMAVASTARRPRPFGAAIHTSWGGWALPSMHTALFAMTAVGVVYTCVPAGRARTTAKWVAGAAVALLGLSRVWLGADAPVDVLAGAAVGVTVPLACFRLLAPNEAFPVTWRRGSAAHLDVTGPRGEACLRAMREQLGVDAVELRPIGLAGSSGSTPLRVRVAGDQPGYLFAKLYARNHVRADRWYKLGRELRYGRLEDESPFASVRRLVQQEDYALSLMQRAGLPSARPIGIVEVTAGSEYLLVTEFVEGAVEIGEADVDDEAIDDGLRIIRGLRAAGLAHRDIKPANLLVRDGRVFLVDVSFAEVRPSAWRQAVDLANMLLVLALRSDVERVYRRALRQFSVDEISEAFAASRGLTMPSQLRRMLRAAGRDLQAEFVRLLPERPVPVAMQRWSLRRVGLLLAAVVVVLAALSDPGGLYRNEVAQTPLYSQDVGCKDLEALWLMAQSVPSASQVPCVRALPDGWTLAEATVNDGRSTFTIDIDASVGAVFVQLTAVCDPRDGAVEVPVGLAGVRRLVRTEQGRVPTVFWYDRFAGGCVSGRLRMGGAPTENLRAEAIESLTLVSRVGLDRALQERSGGRLRLYRSPS